MPRISSKSAVQLYVRELGWQRVGQAEWIQLRARFPHVSEALLRGALQELALTVEQPFAGVGTKTLEELEASLIAMAEAYAAAPAECRAVVIAAKDRARFAFLNGNAAPEKRALKGEMVEWILVWLGDPGMFAAWVGLRKSKINGTGHGPGLL